MPINALVSDAKQQGTTRHVLKLLFRSITFSEGDPVQEWHHLWWNTLWTDAGAHLWSGYHQPPEALQCLIILHTAPISSSCIMSLHWNHRAKHQCPWWTFFKQQEVIMWYHVWHGADKSSTFYEWTGGKHAQIFLHICSMLKNLKWTQIWSKQTYNSWMETATRKGSVI